MFESKIFAAAIGMIATLSPLVSEAEVEVYGFAAARAGVVESTESWLSDGFGRFDSGAEAAGESEFFAELDTQVAVDWHLGDRALIHVQVLARAHDADVGGDDIGLVEAYARFQAVDSGSNSLSISAGQKFFGTSFENVDDLWQSPYTQSFSTWNSWIGHEFRPIGIEANYTHFMKGGDQIGFRGSAFVGNDSSGAELAWGGWRVSQRLSTLGEVIPLPQVATLADTGTFHDQRDDGSKPFGPDLDNDIGYAAQLSYSMSTLKLRYTFADNRGDRDLHRGEYAWETEFSIFGFEWKPSEAWTVIGEFADGSTGMGPPAGAQVDVDFRSAYILASWTDGVHRISARAEDFDVEDRDGFFTDNSEEGNSWTLAYFYQPGDWRFGVEYTDIDVERISAFQSGFDPDNSGKRLTLEARWLF